MKILFGETKLEDFGHSFAVCCWWRRERKRNIYKCFSPTADHSAETSSSSSPSAVNTTGTLLTYLAIEKHHSFRSSVVKPTTTQPLLEQHDDGKRVPSANSVDCGRCSQLLSTSYQPCPSPSPSSPNCGDIHQLMMMVANTPRLLQQEKSSACVQRRVGDSTVLEVGIVMQVVLVLDTVIHRRQTDTRNACNSTSTTVGTWSRYKKQQNEFQLHLLFFSFTFYAFYAAVVSFFPFFWSTSVGTEKEKNGCSRPFYIRPYL